MNDHRHAPVFVTRPTAVIKSAIMLMRSQEDDRPLWKRIFGIDKPPMVPVSFPGKIEHPSFKVKYWPFALGDKRKETVVEDLTLYGAFSINKIDDVYECVCDFFLGPERPPGPS